MPAPYYPAFLYQSDIPTERRSPGASRGASAGVALRTDDASRHDLPPSLGINRRSGIVIRHLIESTSGG